MDFMGRVLPSEKKIITENPKKTHKNQPPTSTDQFYNFVRCFVSFLLFWSGFHSWHLFWTKNISNFSIMSSNNVWNTSSRRMNHIEHSLSPIITVDYIRNVIITPVFGGGSCERSRALERISRVRSRSVGPSGPTKRIRCPFGKNTSRVPHNLNRSTSWT